jgi:hypothetical protein
MNRLFHKILPLFLALLVVPSGPGHGTGRSFVISKDNLLERAAGFSPLSPVRITSNTSLLPPQHHASFVKESFADPDRRYKLSVDLRGFITGQVHDLSELLCFIAQSPDVGGRVPVLTLENGTSYKFNHLLPGVRVFFERTPHAVVSYHQTGTQTPAAARKALQLLTRDSFKEGVLSPRGNHAHVEQQAFDDILSIAVLKKLAERVSPVMAPGCFLTEIHPQRPLKLAKDHVFPATSQPTDILSEVVTYGELTTRVEFFESRWRELGENPEAPLGLERPNQVVCRHAKDLAHIEDFTPLVLIVEGAFSGDMRKILDICRKMRGLRCLVIRNSICHAPDFLELMPPPEEGGAAVVSDASRPDGNALRFVDVRSAFQGREKVTSLRPFLQQHNLHHVLPRFIHLFSEDEQSSEFEALSSQEQQAHRSFWVFESYLAFLNDLPTEPTEPSVPSDGASVPLEKMGGSSLQLSPLSESPLTTSVPGGGPNRSDQPSSPRNESSSPDRATTP